MENAHKLKLILLLTLTTFFIFFVLFVYYYLKRRSENRQKDIENTEHKDGAEEFQGEDLVTFQGGDNLTIFDILDAPGEVIGKSNYGTLYRAFLQQSNAVRVLRFLRPLCAIKDDDFGEAIQFLGRIRHPNLVPLLGFYAGPRGEKLLVHPFYKRANLARFIRGKVVFIYRFHHLDRFSVWLLRKCRKSMTLTSVFFDVIRNLLFQLDLMILKCMLSHRHDYIIVWSRLF